MRMTESAVGEGVAESPVAMERDRRPREAGGVDVTGAEERVGLVRPFAVAFAVATAAPWNRLCRRRSADASIAAAGDEIAADVGDGVAPRVRDRRTGGRSDAEVEGVPPADVGVAERERESRIGRAENAEMAGV